MSILNVPYSSFYPWREISQAVCDTAYGKQTLTITYSIVKQDTPVYHSGQILSAQPSSAISLSESDFAAILSESFQEWEKVFASLFPDVTIQFIPIGIEKNTLIPLSDDPEFTYPIPNSTNTGNVRIAIAVIPSKTFSLSSTSFASLDRVGNAGSDLIISSNYQWRKEDAPITINTFSLKWALVHEIGRIIGLPLMEDNNYFSIMSPDYETTTGFDAIFPQGLVGFSPWEEQGLFLKYSEAAELHPTTPLLSYSEAFYSKLNLPEASIVWLDSSGSEIQYRIKTTPDETAPWIPYNPNTGILITSPSIILEAIAWLDSEHSGIMQVPIRILADLTPILLSPENNSETVNPSPLFRWIVPKGQVGGKYEFLVEIAENSQFTKNVRKYSSLLDKNGFSFRSAREANSNEVVSFKTPDKLI